MGALVAGLFGVHARRADAALRGDYLAIVTLGFGEIVRIFLNNLNAR
jgi:branched-chain amino acid transport system permease protein